MTKQPRKQLTLQSVPARLRGRLNVYYSKKVGWVARKWRGPSIGPRSEAELRARDNFKNACHYVKICSPTITMAAMDFAKNTNKTYKDYLIQCMYGYGPEGWLPDGSIYAGARALPTMIQSLLDSITSKPGSLLLRSPNGWVGITPAEAGTVLTSNGEQAMPAWLPGGGGGGGGSDNLAMVELLGYNGALSQGSATTGQLFATDVPIQVTGLYGAVQCPIPNATYAGILTIVDDLGKITSTIGKTEVVTFESAAKQSFMLPIDTEPTLAPGTTYGINVVRTDGGPTDGTHQFFQNAQGNWTGVPFDINQITEHTNNIRLVLYNSNVLDPIDVAPSSTFTSFTASCGFRWKFPAS